jgi:hypothetical protein
MRRLTVFGGSILIIVGILLLLDGMNIINVDVGGLIFAILIIGIGAWILWGVVANKSIVLENANVPLEGAQRAIISIRHGAGRLRINPLPGGDDLVSGNFNGGVRVNTNRQQDKVNVALSVPERSFPYFWSSGSSLDWDVQLATGIPLELNFDLGASENRLDLSKLTISGLRFNSGASSTWVTLPASAGVTRAWFRTGAASLEIKIPDGVAARIQTSAGLASTTIDRKRFPKNANFYQSPDFDTAVNKVDIRIETAVGSVDVR